MEWDAAQSDLKISLPTLQTNFAVTFYFTSKVSTLAMGFRSWLLSQLSEHSSTSCSEYGQDYGYNTTHFGIE